MRYDQQPAWGASLPENTMERRVLLGDSVHDRLAPPHTLSEALAAFYSPEGHAFGLDADRLSKHLLLLGGIGSGKTNAVNLLLSQLLRQLTGQDVMLIFDAKGDYYRAFYQPGNPRHIVIGNGRHYQHNTLRWNIFGELTGPGFSAQDCELAAKEMASQLFADRQSPSQPFFHMAAADLTAKAMISFLRQASTSWNAPALCNRELVQFLRGADARTYHDMTQRWEDFRSAQLYFGDPSQKLTGQALGVFGTINAMVSDLMVGIFGDGDGGERDFSMRDLVRRRGGTVVFVEYDLALGDVLGPVYRILFDMALKEALSQDSDAQGSVYLVIDEFKLLPNLRHIDDALNFGRSLGVKVIAGVQSVNQLYDIYGEYRGKALLAGFMNSFCFQTWDAESREWVSRRFGSNYQDLTFRSSDMPMHVQREGYAVEDWDIRRLRVGQACVNITGESPFLFQFDQYR